MNRRDLFKAAAALVAPAPKLGVYEFVERELAGRTLTIEGAFVVAHTPGSWPLVWADDFERWKRDVDAGFEKLRSAT